ncbi:hypothetical protein [Lachnoclostridium phocaeense]|uniref:hypothetical protein n=1 Tax=Lachnoclostridium phocaeense TaxID=1871021 RepID=UPI00248D71A6|nr:hypothetical protein [Lachnoclostridium phocaeense]
MALSPGTAMPSAGGGTIAMYSNAIRGNALQPFPRMMAERHMQGTGKRTDK